MRNSISTHPLIFLLYFQNKGEGSKEYLTFIQCTQDLRLAVRSHLLSLGASLIAKHVITPDQEEELRNHHHSVGDRAATLIKLVQDKVRQDPKYYHIFMDILGKDLSQNRGILEILRNTYEPMQLQATSGMPVEIQGMLVVAFAAKNCCVWIFLYHWSTLPAVRLHSIAISK